MSCNRFRSMLVSLIFFALYTSHLSANPTEKMLWENALATFDVTKSSLGQGSDLADISRILTSKCNNTWSNGYEVDALTQQASAYNSDVGLEFRAGYTTADIAPDQDNLDGNTYMELSWELLRNGYTDHQYQAADLRRQAALKTISGKIKQHEINYQCRRYNMAQYFAGLEAHLTTIKLQFMEAVYRVEKDAYLSGGSYFDELMITEEDIVLARQSLARLNATQQSAVAIAKFINPPVIDVDLGAILTQIEQNKDFIESRRIARERVTEQYKQEDSFLQGSRFRLFLRKEFDLAYNGGDELVAGLRLQVPITLGKLTSQTEARLNQLENDLSLEQWEIVTRTRAAYQALQEQLERTTRQQYRLLRAQERMRRVISYTALDLPLDIAAVNVRLKTFIDAAIELGQSKQELYRRVNEIFLVSRVSYDEKYIKVNSLNETQHRARSGERSIYLWSEQFNRYTNQELFVLFETKAIKHAILSASSKVNQAKLFQLMKEADRHNVSVSQLLGESHWALAPNHPEALATVEARVQYGNSIHLDIEPHTLADYKQNADQILQDLVELISAIRLRHPNLDLAISVPHYWPDNIIRALNDYVDHIYLMAYESSDADLISKRIKRVLASVPQAKLVVALRKEDFKTELQLEAVIELLTQSTGTTRFAIHKLDVYTQE